MRKIAKDMHLSRNTVRAYLKKDDFSPAAPVKTVRPSILDPFKSFIDSVLESDKLEWRKQRHTAVRLFDRLRKEHGYTGSYNTVVTYVRARKAEMSQSIKDEYNDLVWAPGFVQFDFGDAYFKEGENKPQKSFAVFDFVHSNQGFTQIFDGETSECLCQGLKDVFEFIGGVPHTIIFDGTSAVGRRFAGIIKESRLFMAFRLHYGFDFRVCSPNSGHEKGGVESKVDWIRHNMFVPVPTIHDMEQYNRTLLNKCLEQGEKIHYQKERPQKELFDRDLAALLQLPEKPFDVVRYEHYKTNKKGYVTVDQLHTYSVSPRLAYHEVIVALRAHEVMILDSAGCVLETHRRKFGTKRTESINHVVSLTTLINKPRAWQQSKLRDALDDEVRDFLDLQPKDILVDYLKCMREQAKRHELTTVLSAFDALIRRGGTFSPSDVAVTAARMDGFGLTAAPERGPDLNYYDKELLGVTR
jgi:transposase